MVHCRRTGEISCLEEDIGLLPLIPAVASGRAFRDSSRPNVRVVAKGRVLKASLADAVGFRPAPDFAIGRRGGAKANGGGGGSMALLNFPLFRSSGEGSGGESATVNVIDELNDWSTSAGKSTSVLVGEGPGETLGDRDGECSWLIVNDSTSGEDEKAAILFGSTKR